MLKSHGVDVGLVPEVTLEDNGCSALKPRQLVKASPLSSSHPLVVSYVDGAISMPDQVQLARSPLGATALRWLCGL